MPLDHQGHKEVQRGNEYFVLSDPAIHVAKMGERALLDELTHSLDGNRRKDGVREFAVNHRCGPICKHLRLKPK